MEKTRKNKVESRGAAQRGLSLAGLLMTVEGVLLELVFGSGLSVLPSTSTPRSRGERPCAPERRREGRGASPH